MALDHHLLAKAQANQQATMQTLPSKNVAGPALKPGATHADPPKPKRPLSAFNLFYRYKRQRILAHVAAGQADRESVIALITSPPGLEGYSAPSLEMAAPAALAELRTATIRRELADNLLPRDTRDRQHRKDVMGGVISFVELGKLMNASWKDCDDIARTAFRELSEEGRATYRTNLEEYMEATKDTKKEDRATKALLSMSKFQPKPIMSIGKKKKGKGKEAPPRSSGSSGSESSSHSASAVSDDDSAKSAAGKRPKAEPARAPKTGPAAAGAMSRPTVPAPHAAPASLLDLLLKKNQGPAASASLPPHMMGPLAGVPRAGPLPTYPRPPQDLLLSQGLQGYGPQGFGGKPGHSQDDAILRLRVQELESQLAAERLQSRIRDLETSLARQRSVEGQLRSELTALSRQNAALGSTLGGGALGSLAALAPPPLRPSASLSSVPPQAPRQDPLALLSGLAAAREAERNVLALQRQNAAVLQMERSLMAQTQAQGQAPKGTGAANAVSTSPVMALVQAAAAQGQGTAVGAEVPKGSSTKKKRKSSSKTSKKQQKVPSKGGRKKKRQRSE